MEVQQKLQRTFVREEAYLILRDWIVEGKLVPGQKLRDKDLAEQLGVSRTPIRESLLRLEDEGLVQTKPNRSTLVSPIDFHNVYDLYAIVWTLEGLALQQSYDHLKSEHIEAMVKANKNLLQALHSKDRFLAVQADNEFHSIFIQLSQNEELNQILSGLKYKLKRLELYYFEKAKDAFLSYEEHQQIINALKQKDLSATLKAIELNWKASLARIQTT